jgi:hypothetical protein
MKRGTKIGKKKKATAQKAAKQGRRVAEMVKELNDKARCVNAPGQMSYIAAAADGMLASGTQSTHDAKAVSLQAQRGITVTPKITALTPFYMYLARLSVN